VRVVVTDADYKLTLGAIRSLGRRGVEVVALAGRPRALGFASRYAAERVVAPPPDDEERFAAFVAEQRADAVLPIGQASVRALVHHPPPQPAPLPDREAFAVADSKARTLELARELGVPTPRPADAFPAVAKSSTGSGDVRYVASADEVPEGWLLQEYVEGEGRGLFALMDRGEPRAVFMHRRLREYPITGGASTAAESIDDPVLRELGLRLLQALRWHGVAMVEFKRRPDGSYVLMEINPKFWGSLDLAIAAGVDFPWLAVQLATGQPFEPVRSYAVGVRFQWVFPDLLHAAARPRDLPQFALDLVRAQHDLDRSDLRPSAREAPATARAIVTRALNGSLRHPHGVPQRTRTGPRT